MKIVVPVVVAVVAVVAVVEVVEFVVVVVVASGALVVAVEEACRIRIQEEEELVFCYLI